MINKTDDIEILDHSKPIGEGAFSKVLKCRLVRDNRIYALKIINMDRLSRADCENLKLEIKLHQHMNHPHIIKYYDSMQIDQIVYILLEYAPNHSLFYYIHPRKGIPERLALRFLYQTSLAVKYLHEKGVLHRDIKPENLLFNDKFEIKLCDFGWSYKLDHEKDERFSICGTYEYMSPEILTNNPHGKKTDIWCLGILMYEMIYGTPPFKAKTLNTMKKQYEQRSINLDLRISSDTQDLMYNMLRQDATKRFDIDQVLTHPAITKRLAEFRQPICEEDYSIIMKNYYINSNGPRTALMKEIEDLVKKVRSNEIHEPLPRIQKLEPTKSAHPIKIKLETNGTKQFPIKELSPQKAPVKYSISIQEFHRIIDKSAISKNLVPPTESEPFRGLYQPFFETPSIHPYQQPQVSNSFTNEVETKKSQDNTAFPQAKKDLKNQSKLLHEFINATIDRALSPSKKFKKDYSSNLINTYTFVSSNEVQKKTEKDNPLKFEYTFKGTTNLNSVLYPPQAVDDTPLSSQRWEKDNKKEFYLQKSENRSLNQDTSILARSVSMKEISVPNAMSLQEIKLDLDLSKIGKDRHEVRFQNKILSTKMRAKVIDMALQNVTGNFPSSVWSTSAGSERTTKKIALEQFDQSVEEISKLSSSRN